MPTAPTKSKNQFTYNYWRLDTSKSNITTLQNNKYASQRNRIESRNSKYHHHPIDIQTYLEKNRRIN